MKFLFWIFLSLIVYVLIVLGEKTKNIESVLSILFDLVLDFWPIYQIINIILNGFISDSFIINVLTTIITHWIVKKLSDGINGKIKKIKKNAPTYSKGIIAIFTVRKLPINENSNTEGKDSTFTFNNNIIGKIVIYINNKLPNKVKTSLIIFNYIVLAIGIAFIYHCTALMPDFLYLYGMSIVSMISLIRILPKEVIDELF